jgi:hypothetical protein
MLELDSWEYTKRENGSTTLYYGMEFFLEDEGGYFAENPSIS